MRVIRNFFAMLAVFAAAGCCTIMEKGTYSIPLSSSEPDTKVKVYAGILDRNGNVRQGSGELVATISAPGSVTVSARQSDTYTFFFDKEGYMPMTQHRVANVSSYIYGNIIFLIGAPIGLMVDSSTGCNRPFSEAPIHVNMVKKYHK